MGGSVMWAAWGYFLRVLAEPHRGRFQRFCVRAFLAVGVGLALQAPLALGQSTAFTYQGRLVSGGGAANGVYDFCFALYDAPTNGALVANTLTNFALPVSNGVFSATCDFGSDAFAGPPRWLEIGVRPSAGGAFAASGSAGVQGEAASMGAPFVALAPRQAVFTPYASFAGGVPAAGIRGVIPAASAGVVAAVNGTATNLTIAGNLSGLGAGLTNYGGYAFVDTRQLAAASNALTGSLAGLQRGAATNNIFNVRAYGATGNSSTIDSVAIKAAWDDWQRYGGTLYFPYGTYKDTNTYTMHGAGQVPFRIRGDGQYNSIWRAWNLNNQVFVEAQVDVSGLTFEDGSRTGFNIGFRNMDSVAGMKLDDVRFLNWSGIGWQTDCAGAQGLDLNFTGNKIGLRLAGFADGGTFMGRMADNFVGIEVGGTDQGSAIGTPQPATHGNMFRFEGPRNVYPYVVGRSACCTIEGYLEVVNNAVSVGYPPEVATLIPGIAETNDYTDSLVVQNLGGFGGTNQPNNAAKAFVAIYTPVCHGITIRNTTFLANTCVLSKSAGGDATPVILEHAIPGGPVMTFSDGTTLQPWLPANVAHTGEINTTRRVYSGTNLVFDVNSFPYLVGQTDPSWLSAPDPDATNFIARAGLTDLTQKTAISKLVKDLKAAGLWYKWYCLYPFVGGTPNSTACNLVSSKYTINWSASPAPLFSALGVTGVTNAPGAFGDTQFNPQTAGVSQNDFSVFAYNLSAAPAYVSPPGFGVFIGVCATNRASLGHNYNAVRMDGLMNNNSIQGNFGPYSSDLRGPLLATRSSSSTGVLYTDWITTGYSDSTVSAGVPGASLYVLAKNDQGPYMPTGATLAMAGAGHGFSLAEWNRLRAICDNFNALLGRRAP